jgi:protocatechuate 3,4-dioxygenase alpha subunit
VEIWQADASGRYRHPDDPRGGAREPRFDGFGRVHTDAAGRFAFETVKPGPVPGSGRPQAPHLVVGLFARGLLARLVTRIYFDDEASNAGDPVLACVPPDRRPTLIAASRGDGAYRFDIALQGPNETVFFDV